MQLIGETAAPRTHFMFTSIRMARQADYAYCRTPFADQQCDLGKLGVVGRRRNRRQRLRLSNYAVADRHANTLQSKIEPKNRLHWWPLSGVPCFGSQHHRIDPQ